MKRNFINFMNTEIFEDGQKVKDIVGSIISTILIVLQTYYDDRIIQFETIGGRLLYIIFTAIFIVFVVFSIIYGIIKLFELELKVFEK